MRGEFARQHVRNADAINIVVMEEHGDPVASSLRICLDVCCTQCECLCECGQTILGDVSCKASVGKHMGARDIEELVHVMRLTFVAVGSVGVLFLTSRRILCLTLSPLFR